MDEILKEVTRRAKILGIETEHQFLLFLFINELPPRPPVTTDDVTAFVLATTYNPDNVIAADLCVRARPDTHDGLAYIIRYINTDTERTGKSRQQCLHELVENAITLF